MQTKVPQLTPYTSQYKEACFQSWYAANRPTYSDALMEALPEDEYGRKPVLDTIRNWRNEDNWDLWADKLDIRAREKADGKAINAKVDMLEKQAKRGLMLQDKAAEYFEENEFDSSSSAVQGLIQGAKLERESRGLSTALLRVMQLGDDELISETQKLLERALESGDDIIDVAEIEDA